MRIRILLAVLGLLAAGCQTVPPPDPVTMEEVVDLAQGGANSPALLKALETRPLGFPLTFESLKALEERGVPAPVLDTVVALSVERRARSIAPRYSTYWYDPYYYPWPFRWNLGIGYHHYR